MGWGRNSRVTLKATGKMAREVKDRREELERQKKGEGDEMSKG